MPNVREIVRVGDHILREKAVPVRRFDERLHRLLEDMALTMREAEGVGLAAPQVGISKRVIVVEEEGQVKEYAGGYDDWLRQRPADPPAAAEWSTKPPVTKQTAIKPAATKSATCNISISPACKASPNGRRADAKLKPRRLCRARTGAPARETL